ncbi:MAG: hypothetical protein E5W97_10970 [Mesorhizobium sp.]|nr:MAG: hypothetical protein E5W97_10970 [Mesorhizobium sp.]
MQLVRTEVGEAIGHNGQPVLRVSFCGEGGERVSVDMANAEPLAGGGESRAIGRAKALLVQTATFDAAANDYDAESNGNFDEVAATSAQTQSGAGLYIFEYRDGDGGRLVPQAGVPSFEAAREEAIRCAIDLLIDLQPGTDDLSGWLVRVRDEHGTLLCSIDVSDAELARQASAAAV